MKTAVKHQASATTLASSFWKISAPLNSLKPATELCVARKKRVKITLASENDQQLTTEPEARDSSDAGNNTDGGVRANGSAPLQAEPPVAPAKKAPLTAREKLRAARVLGKYADSPPPASRPRKPSEFGSNVLDALRENDKGKRKQRSGLPEAPTNMFDDSNRGASKEGWTLDFLPVGTDALVIAASFILISTLMFATTYLVWKVGAIHFNEY